MKVEIEELDSVKRRIRVEVPARRVDDALEKAFRNLNKRVRIKGFRPGKAPRSVLERYYGDRVRYEVSTQLIEETYSKSVEEKALKPVSQPSIEEVQLKPGEDFRYTAVVEVKPQIEVSDYLGLELPAQPSQLDESAVEQRLEQIREAYAKLVDIEEDRPAGEGDVIVVEHTLMMEGESPEGQNPQEQLVELHPDKVEEKFLKALCGMRKGEETVVTHRFPEDDPNPKLAGKEGRIRIRLKAIKRKELPPLDDELAKKVGDYESLHALRERVRQDLEEAESRRQRSAIHEAIIDELIKRHPIEVPPSMVELQIRDMIQALQRRMAAQGATLDTSEENIQRLRQRFREAAVRAVRASLLLEAVAEKEGIEVTDEDLERAFEEIARRTGRSSSEVRALYKDPSALESLKANVLEEKTLDFLRDHAKMKEEKRTTKRKRGKKKNGGK